jgi:hypothetical protein
MRELKELRAALSHSITGNRNAVLFDYLKPLADLINASLLESDKVNFISSLMYRWEFLVF